MTDASGPLVSVVTPFYNTAEHLEPCIRSVLNQDYSNFEYVLADNRSTDGGDRLARRFAERHEAIRYVRYEEFLDQIPNYNRALGEASPEAKYIKMVQADDKLLPGCLSKMVALAEAHPAVGVVSSYRLKGREVSNVGLPLDREVIPGPELCRLQLLENHFFMGNPTTLLYRAEAVRADPPLFPRDRLHADTEACYELLREWDFGFVHQILSFNRKEEDSISGTVRTFNPHLLDRLIIIRRFGPVFLTDDEYHQLWERTSRRYWRYLARSLLALQGKEFWQYHREGLATIGMSIRPTAVAASLLPAIGHALLHPAETIDALARAVTRMKNRLSRALGGLTGSQAG